MKRNLIYILLFLLFFVSCKETVKSPVKTNTVPVLYPDYVGVTVPVTIAPLNFTINSEKFDLIDVEVTGKNTGSIHVQDHEIIQFPECRAGELRRHHGLMGIQTARGERIFFFG